MNLRTTACATGTPRNHDETPTRSVATAREGRSRHFFILLAVSWLAFQAASAQDQEPRMFGIGVSLNPSSLISISEEVQPFFLPIGFTNFYFPINVSRNFRVEPEGGIFTISASNVSIDPFIGRSASSSSFLRLGLGLFYVMPLQSAFNAYIGPRIGMLSQSSTRTSTGSDDRKMSERDLFLGGAAGGEYFFSQHFSLGGEAQINYISFGQPETTEGGTPLTSGTLSRNMVTNNALVFARWYF
jgi:hypothetical protein